MYWPWSLFCGIMYDSWHLNENHCNIKTFMYAAKNWLDYGIIKCRKACHCIFGEQFFFLTSSTVWLCSRCCLFCRCKCPSHVQYDVAVFQWRWLCGSCSEVHCQKGGYAVLSHRQKKCPKRVCRGWPARGWVAGVIQCSCRYSAHIYKHAGLKRVLNTNLRFLHESSRCFVEPLGQTHFPYTSKLRSTGTANWCPWIVCDASYWLVWTSSQCCCHIIVWTQLTMALSSMPFLSCLDASIIWCWARM